MHQINVLSSAIFFKTISEELNRSFTLSDYSVIIGGDFNVIFDQELDGISIKDPKLHCLYE